MTIQDLVQFAYVVSAGLFVFALYWMNSPKTAGRSVTAGSVAMLIAIAATWLQPEILNHG